MKDRESERERGNCGRLRVADGIAGLTIA